MVIYKFVFDVTFWLRLKSRRYWPASALASGLDMPGAAADFR
jgi:hypothetical protein